MNIDFKMVYIYFVNKKTYMKCLANIEYTLLYLIRCQ